MYRRLKECDVGGRAGRKAAPAESNQVPHRKRCPVLVPGSEADESLGFAPDEIRHALADHHGRDVGVGADAVGHYGGVDHA